MDGIEPQRQITKKRRSNAISDHRGKENLYPRRGGGLINAIHAAMMEGLKAPQWDKNIRLVVHEPHRFASPPDKGDRYTLVNIDLFAGRSLEAKRALYQAIVANLEKCGIPADHVLILLREAIPENWGVRGGLPASEVSLGFKIDV